MIASPSTQPHRFNPWLSMWLHPRSTIQTIVDSDPLSSLAVLVPLLLIASGVFNWVNAVWTDADTYMEYLPMALLRNSATQCVSVLLFCLALKWIAHIAGDTVPFSHLLAAYCWSQLPVLGQALLATILIAAPVTASSDAGTLLYLAVMLGGLAFSIWSLVLWFGAGAQVMRCSPGAVFWRGIAASVILIAPLLALSYLFASIM